jgi:predicted DNA-binding helix-hairpin-helix protein
MDDLEKLKLISMYMDDEVTQVPPCPAETYPASRQDNHIKSDFPVHMAALPNGQRFPMLKTALTTACERNCYYCAFQSRRDFRRVSHQPDELAAIYMRLYQAGAIKGLFLSSGVAGGGIRTQDRLLDTAEILRKKMGYQDYLHLKIMPGAEKDQVIRAMQLADRVSVNLEAPTTARLRELAPEKQFLDELLKPLKWVEQIRRNQPGQYGWRGRWPSSTTQFVVGGGTETDLELLQTASYLHKELRLKRVYFSGFHPVSDSPFEHRQPVNPWRTHRLYQAAFLLRDYHFDFEEMAFTTQGQLLLEKDPKQAWADQHLLHAPIEINRAEAEELMRVPGIGPERAKAIIAARRGTLLRSEQDLKRLGIPVGRAAPYLVMAGRRPAHQLSFWAM